jgi:hypothetical protein
VKILHFCWFGSPLPTDVSSRLDRWQKLHPSWTICQWNESNINVSGCAYAEACLQRRDWAYLSDYVRLQALAKEGGVYLDTDVELLKPLDVFIDDSFHIGYMHNCALGTALMISPPQHPLLLNLIAQYQTFPSNRGIINNAILTEFFLKHVEGFRLTGKSWSNKAIYVHPKTWFEQPTFSIQGGYAVHLYNRSWDNSFRSSTVNRAPSNWSFFVSKRCMRTFWEELRCYYFPFYLRDRFGIRPFRIPPLTTISRTGWCSKAL